MKPRNAAARRRLRRMVFAACLLAAAVAVLFAFGAGDAWARMGGGHSYGGGHSSGGHSSGGHSSGGSHSSSGFHSHGGGYYGGGGCGDFGCGGMFFVFLVIAVVIVLVVIAQRNAQRNLLITPPIVKPDAERQRVKKALDALRVEDPNFSEILFLDFVQMIYARYQESRGAGGEPDVLLPYLAAELLDALRTARKTDLVVDGVIVGESEIADVREAGQFWSIEVNLETNFTERAAQAKDGAAWWTRSAMTFQRKKGAPSKGPEFVRSLNCPSCGSPVKIDASGACAYCGKVVRPGEFAWQLTGLRVEEQSRREEIELELGGAEIGTDLPTIFDPALDAERKAFALHYPDFSWDEFNQRVSASFFALQKAWTERNWNEARPYETDRLFQTHLFWIQRYLDNGCTNVLKDIQLLKAEVAHVGRDPYFDIITVRVWGSMIDYTVDRAGKLIDGNESVHRKFTEYWTFIRRAGFKPKTDRATGEAAAHGCPSCGAPLKVSMAGVCEFCGSHVTGGDFDWTLAKIEQDEAYRGA